ncbi:winged helix-turn-helix domain-containing protein [Caballeronia sp. RCC_10]|uniref:winged helix-turn-helix domain-containing protein n=1 Tax=Caballeronia sp. RCC_10 TaxID=3239227 RepID=UPI0035255AE8
MTKKSHFDAYFHLLELSKTVQGLPSMPKLDPVEERVLKTLTSSWHSGHPLTVSKTMALSEGGSPATVHRKLNNLKIKGLISFEESAKDLRIKNVIPTRKALDYFETLAACLEGAKTR